MVNRESRDFVCGKRVKEYLTNSKHYLRDENTANSTVVFYWSKQYCQRVCGILAESLKNENMI